MNTYKEQFDKLTRAYINDEVNPYSECACFVGNLLDGSREWAKFRRGDCYKGKGEVFIASFPIDGYTTHEIVALENCFMEYIWENIKDKHEKFTDCSPVYNELQNKEDVLFEAFEKTLALLKEIHISKGENIEEEFEFKKRELVFS